MGVPGGEARDVWVGGVGEDVGGIGAVEGAKEEAKGLEGGSGQGGDG